MTPSGPTDARAAVSADVHSHSGCPVFAVTHSAVLGGTQIRKIVERGGTGPPARPGAKVAFLATSWVREGGAVTSPNLPTAITGMLGEHVLLPEHELAVGSMCAGERALFLLPPEAREARVMRIDLQSVVVPLDAADVLCKDPFAAVAVFGDALLCIAAGRFQPLWGEYARVVRDPIEEMVTVGALAERHQLGDEEIELFGGLFQHLIQSGILLVQPGAREAISSLTNDDE